MVRARKKSGKQAKILDNVYGWVFSAPLLIGLTLFLFIPLGIAFYYSLTNIGISEGYTLEGYTWNNFENYVDVFTDEIFGRSLLNALINCIGVPIGMVIALVLSTFLVNNKKGSTLFRVIYYIPTICGSAVIAYIWKWLYSGNGLVNNFIEFMFNTRLDLSGGVYFMPSMIIMGIWSGYGTSVLLLYAQLKNIPHSLYEAASIDGAGGFRKFFSITVPGVMPTLFFILITGISGSFQDFARFNIMASSLWSPYCAMPASLVYDYTQKLEFGKGCAYGIVLGAIITVIFIVQNVITRRLNKNA